MEGITSKDKPKLPEYVWRNFPEFLKKLKGWKVNPDGEAFCSDCFPKWLAKIEPEFRQTALEDSRPLSDSKNGIARNRRSADGWFISCEYCQRDISVPFERS